MYKTHFLQGSNVFRVIYKTYANKLTKVKSLAKKLYIARELSNCKGDGRKMWEAVKTLIPSNSTKKSKATPSELRIDGSLIQNPKLMADEFCKHFTNIADSILDSLNLTSYTSDFKHYLPKRVTDSIFMQPTDLAEVFAAIMSLKSNKSCGVDYIPPKIFKSSANIISEPLSQLINKAFLLGIFPDSLKIAKVVPIYKSGDKRNPSNYRPISLLTCFSKIFEKLIFTRINSFICKHSILAPSQYGFRKGCSTIHAVTEVITTAYDNISANLHTGLVFLDIKKAFDTVSHDILIQKLEHYGIRGIANDLLNSYLRSRKQFVMVDEIEHSDLFQIKSGVPQGSTLGPLLFLLYINDLVNSTSATTILFADDTCLSFSASCPTELIDDINTELISVYHWMKANKLCINAKKSTALLIPSNSKLQIQNKDILYNDAKISVCKSAKYLGVQIDSDLNFKSHIQLLYNKLSRSVGIMFKVKKFLPKNVLTQLYHAMFNSHLIYCITIWTSTFSTHLNSIRILQNKAVKLLAGVHWRHSSSSVYKSLNILKLDDMIKLQTALFVHRHFNNNLPINFQGYFTNVNTCHSIATRRQACGLNYHIPRCRSSKLQRSIKYKGVKIWNSTPLEMRKFNLKKFKKSLKNLYLKSY